MNGIATSILSWDDKRLMLCNPPRSIVYGDRGMPLGSPGDAAGQRQILEKALALLEKPAPLDIIVADDRYAGEG
jgi:hypothetical protein